MNEYGHRAQQRRTPHALSAFLDQKFREYDYRRGAADARRVALDVLGITQNVTRPEGEAFYRPDDDTTLNQDLSSYDILGSIDSSREAGRNVREVFERALKGRIKALVNQIDPPGPDLVYAWALERIILKKLPDIW